MTENRQQYIANHEPNLPLGRKLTIATWVITVAVWALVGVMRRPEKIPLPEGVSLHFLPAVYSTLNVVAALLLVLALVMIKRGHVQRHKQMIAGAMSCSGLFLLLYVAYHFTTAQTSYGGEGVMRVAYFLLLISHIVLAAFSLPFILLTWVYGFTNQFAKHRRMAKWVFPMWLYVAVTGPICYLMLRPYYMH